MAKTGEETKPNEVEPSMKVPNGASPANSSSPKKSPENPSSKTPSPAGGVGSGEEKGAGEGSGVPAIVVTPATPEVRTPQKKVEEELNKKLEEKQKDVGSPKMTAGSGALAETSTMSTATSPAPRLLLPIDIDMSSKMSIRMTTWNRLEAEDLVLFPRPCTYRIPRFKGEVEAAERLAKLEVFKQAKLVKVNLDKAHERLRLEIIQSGKELVAGTPGLREAVFLVMHPPMQPSRYVNKLAATRIGIHYLGVALDFQAKQSNLIILGSVAVDKKGRRIGKGEGFSDLEFALLSKLGTIPPDAVIATVVHDAQVYDEFPETLFKPYDVPVDLIITPTRVIEVEKKLERPTLRWEYLSKRRIDDIPIMKQLLDKDQETNDRIVLKEEDSDTETTRRFPPLRRRIPPQRRRQASAPEPRGPMRGRNRRESSAPPPNGNSRTFRRRPRRQTSTSGDSPKERRPQSETLREGSLSKPGRRGPIRRINKPRYTVDYSVKVNGLSSAVRIRDLKAALVERGVRPNDISWRATKGVALLHFAKRRHAQQEAAAVISKGVNDVVAMLQGLSVKPEDGPRMDLVVEVAQPLGPKIAPMVGATA